MRRMWERGALAWCDGWEEGNHSHAYSPVCPYAKSEPHEAVLLVLFGSRFVDSANVGLLHRTQHLCWYRRDDFPDRRLGEYLRRLRALDRGIRLRRDSWVSVRYAEELNSGKSSVTPQRTDRHGILVRQVALKRK